MHTHLLGVLKSGHWPTLMGAWLHLTLSFMVWLLIGALGVPIATTFGLSATETVTALAVPLLGGALFRVMAGWSCDWFGAKRTGVAVLLCELVAVIWGWLGIQSYIDLLLVGLVLGIGGASFAVALPLAGRAYPPAHQGMALGLAASGNIGTVFIAYYAPRWEQMIGWRNVFGLMAIPVVVTLAVFLSLVRDDRAVGPRSVSKGDRTVRWWHAAVALIRHRSHVLVVLHLWRDVWRICRTVQCPAAVFSRLLWNESPLRRDDDGALWSCRKRHATSRCGYGADRISGLASLRVVLPLIVLIVASIGYYLHLNGACPS
jgi:NNP family nitrate/nitrite transporter-like MFS transporter